MVSKKFSARNDENLTLATTPVPDEVTRLEVITALPALAPSLIKVVKMAGGEKGPSSFV